MSHTCHTSRDMHMIHYSVHVMYTSTLTVPSSDPVTSRESPLLAGHMLFTKEVCPLSFLTLSPTSQSHTAPDLSTEHVNTMLRRVGRGRWVGRGDGREEVRGKMEREGWERGVRGGGLGREIAGRK